MIPEADTIPIDEIDNDCGDGDSDCLNDKDDNGDEYTNCSHNSGKNNSDNQKKYGVMKRMKWLKRTWKRSNR